jgi:hypothetical protein
VLDEPTVGLDPVLRRDLWKTFHALASRGATLLVSSRGMGEAEGCDELLFLVTSIAMLRERTSGTLERLMSMPLAKLDLLFGYGLAFALLAAVQATLTPAVAFGLLGVDADGAIWLLVLLAVANAVLGMALGLFLSVRDERSRPFGSCRPSSSRRSCSAACSSPGEHGPSPRARLGRPAADVRVRRARPSGCRGDR